jgi:hypothetical protein
MVSIAGRTECTRLAARTAIPFAFGLRNLVPNDKLDFILRSIDKGELKTVRYSLAFALSGSGKEEDEEDEDGEEDDEDDGDDEEDNQKTQEGSVTKKAAPQAVLRDELTEVVFVDILKRIPPTHTFNLLHAFGFHNAAGVPYGANSDPSLRSKIMSGEPCIPPCRGSVLRAYARSVLDINVDAHEPEIQTIADCVPVDLTEPCAPKK